jgi:hypothetical protein
MFPRCGIFICYLYRDWSGEGRRKEVESKTARGGHAAYRQLRYPWGLIRAMLGVAVYMLEDVLPMTTFCSHMTLLMTWTSPEICG